MHIRSGVRSHCDADDDPHSRKKNGVRPRNSRRSLASNGHPDRAIPAHNGSGCVRSHGDNSCPLSRHSAEARSAGAHNVVDAAAYRRGDRARPTRSTRLRSEPGRESHRDGPACGVRPATLPVDPHSDPIRGLPKHIDARPRWDCNRRPRYSHTGSGRRWAAEGAPSLHGCLTYIRQMSARFHSRRNMSRTVPPHRSARTAPPDIPVVSPQDIQQNESGHLTGRSGPRAGGYSPGRPPDWQPRRQGEWRASCSLTKC